MRRWAGAALAGILLLSGGVLIGALSIPRPPLPSAEAPKTGPRTVPVHLSDFDDSRQVKAKPVWAPAPAITLGADGVITTLDCAPGQTWAAGSTPLSVNDQVLVTIHTSRPLWRDLHGGERGPDVLALQSFLREQGLEPADTGRFDRKTALAWRSFQRDKGMGGAGTEFLLSSVIKLPAAQVTIEKCPVAVGASVSTGTVVALGAATLAELRVSMPVTLAAGERTLTVGGTTAAVDETGLVLEPNAFAGELGSTREDTVDDGEVEATLRLARALKVAMVPPSALFGIVGANGCVAEAAKAVPVVIVSSTLGQTAVAFTGGAVPRRIVAVAPTGLTCD